MANGKIDRIGPKKATRNFIRQWMKKKDRSQIDLAARMDCGPGTISKLLNGKMALTDKWLTGIAEALDLEITDLFRDPDRPTQQDILDGLSRDKQAEVIRFAEYLRKSG